MTKIIIITGGRAKSHETCDKEDGGCGEEEYTGRHGRHFNDKLLSYATGQMRKRDADTGKERRIVPFSRSEVDAMLARNGVKLDKSKGLDYVYVANMAKADFWKSSIEDEKHLALYVKDVIDDCDADEETVFDRWLAGAGDDVPWDELV